MPRLYDAEIDRIQRKTHALQREQAEQEKINQKKKAERAAIAKDIADQKALMDAQKAVDEAASVAADASDPLKQLGISATDATGALKSADQIMYEVADALERMGPGAARAKVEFDLIAAGVDRKLIPALEKGASAYRNFQKAGEAISPPISDEDLARADEFAAKGEKLSEAWGRFATTLGNLGMGPLGALLDKMSGIIAGITADIKWASDKLEQISWFIRL